MNTKSGDHILLRIPVSKIELLQVGPYPAWDEERLNANFIIHRVADGCSLVHQMVLCTPPSR
nr:hypothetical protein SHINE37_42865 [Rhizobiaceae bacterium]